MIAIAEWWFQVDDEIKDVDDGHFTFAFVVVIRPGVHEKINVVIFEQSVIVGLSLSKAVDNCGDGKVQYKHGDNNLEDQEVKVANGSAAALETHFLDLLE